MNNQNVLALDLATKTGWAVRLRDGSIHHGALSVAAPKSAKVGQKWANFRSWLHETITKYDVHVVVFEQIDHFAPMKTARGTATIPTAAIISYSSLRALLELYTLYANLELEGFHIGTIKKHWTGKGNAKKQDMINEALRRGYRVKDDNEADAVAILSLALNEYGVTI